MHIVVCVKNRYQRNRYAVIEELRTMSEKLNRLEKITEVFLWVAFIFSSLSVVLQIVVMVGK